jgi:hypothetical protein
MAHAREDQSTLCLTKRPRQRGKTMDGARFDSLARALAGRLSRRTALRGTSAGIAAGLFAALRPEAGRVATARQQASLPYVVVRIYDAPSDLTTLEQTLEQGYAPQLAQQPGFLSYTVLGNDGGVTTITAFSSADAEEAATNQLSTWVDQNLANLLPNLITTINDTAIVSIANQAALCPPPGVPTPTAAAPTATSAAPTAPAAAPTATAAAPTPTALPVCTDPSRPGVGCACTTGTQNPCGDTTLVCCANDANAAPGAPGTCTPSDVGCQPQGPTPTPEPSPTPCTGIGCPCTAGVEGTCDNGLVCCQSQMGGDNVPGGPGMCAAPDACGDGGDPGATPMP